MRRLTTAFCLLFFIITAQAQTKISGNVKDAKGHLLSGVSIAIKDSYDGATTDSTGYFAFSTTEKGSQVLVVTSIGFKPEERPVQIAAHPIEINVILKEDVSELKAVVISAGSFEASDKKKATVLNSLDIVTTASANADITAAIKTLPGSQQVGESEGLFVRGGTAAETKTFIDGTLVNNFFYSSVPNIAQRGRFSPFIFKGTVFSAGGYSALYGQALSSALILETIDLPERSSASLSLSPIGASGSYQKLAKNKKSSWGVDYGYTNVAVAFKLLKTAPEYFHIPQFHTGDANFRIKTSGTGILKYYGYFSENKLGVRNPSLDTAGYKDAFQLRNFNMYHNLSWRDDLGHNWKLNIGASYTNNKDHIDAALQDANNAEQTVSGYEFKNFLLTSKGDYLNTKAVWEKRLKGLSTLRFGAEYNYSNDHALYTLYSGQQVTNTIKERLKAAFAESDIYITNNMAAKLGMRVEHSSLFNKANIAPRVSLAYKLGNEGQASVAYGVFYQSPETKYLPSPDILNFSKATHYIAQYQKVSSLTTFRVEAFYKKYNDLVKTDIIDYRDIAANNNGYGYAKGVELFWRDKKSIKNFDYWISYSYLDTKRDFLNYPYAIQPNFAAKHTASLVSKKFVTKLKTQFNASYTYASPRPYYHIQYDASVSKFTFTDQGKTIPYSSLSLSVNYLPSISKPNAKTFTVLVFSINNVLGSKQIFGYQYSYNGLRKEAIVPSTKTFIYFGVFLSFGVDRSQDVINSNL